jgi:hypothetical protein
MLMGNDIDTHLQALYQSGKITSYIHTRLPTGSLKTGWVEQGLLSKGTRGKLRDKGNQESLVIPADRFTRLARDREEWEDAAIVIIGSKGLATSKFIAMVFDQADSQSLVAFQTQGASPNEIITILLQNALGIKKPFHFEEPNLDYIEQLRMDSAEGMVGEMTALSLPTNYDKISNWIKEVLLNPSSESYEIQHGSSNRIPKFAALVTRWLVGLELFKRTSNRIAALLFLGSTSLDACFWDEPQRKAVYVTFLQKDLMSLSEKYLTALWLVPGESLTKPQRHREVTVGPPKVAASNEKIALPKKQDLVTITDIESVLITLTKRVDSLESILNSLNTDSDVVSGDRGTMDVLQTRLAENIDRIELMAKRLIELERRLSKIRS